MSDDQSKDSGAVAALEPEPQVNTGVARRDSQTSRRTTGLKLVTIAPADNDAELESIPAEARADDPYVGQIIDNRYFVEEILGEGGMGVVYRCRHKIIDKKVAMKVLRADMARDPEVTERFLLEAKAASAIGSEHIIDISDFGQFPDGATYFVMEFLDGQSLASLLDGETPVPPDRLIHIARQLAEGLEAAHEAGIVHRDLKPDNIYLVPRRGDDDYVKILDFGIAKVSTGAAGKLTRAGSVFGTPHYMSPEQAAGAPVDHRGDIYAVGVILFEMASGRVPFDADNFMGILTQHMYKAPPPLRDSETVTVDVSPGLEAIILKCMSKRPEERYQDMRALAADIDRLAAGEPPLSVQEMVERSDGFNVPADYFDAASRRTGTGAMPEAVPAEKSRLPLWLGLGAFLAAVVGLGAGVYWRTMQAPPPVAQEPQQAAQGAQAAPAGEPTVEPAVAPEMDLVMTTQVVIGTEPLGAHVFRGDEDLGASPVVLDVLENEPVELTLRHEGYVDKAITLDGSEKKVQVVLEAVKKVAPRYVPRPRNRPQPQAAPAPKPAPKPKLGGGEIVNPWAK